MVGSDISLKDSHSLVYELDDFYITLKNVLTENNLIGNVDESLVHHSPCVIARKGQ